VRGVKWAILAPAHGTEMYVCGLKGDGPLEMENQVTEEDVFATKEEAEAAAFEFVVRNPEDIGEVHVVAVNVKDLLVY
jgi:hypothetical protein